MLQVLLVLAKHKIKSIWHVCFFNVYLQHKYDQLYEHLESKSLTFKLLSYYFDLCIIFIVTALSKNIFVFVARTRSAHGTGRHTEH